MHKVLFVCIGNSCRSQMAEGFARSYGSDVLEPESAGLYPAMTVSRITQTVMRDKNIDVSEHFPKGLSEVQMKKFDIVVNISGQMLPVQTKARVLHWEVEDPIGADKSVYKKTCNEIEILVQRLISQLRATPPSPEPARAPGGLKPWSP